MKRRKKNLYFGFGPSKPTNRERRKSRTEFQAGVRRKRSGYKRVREKESSTLFKQLQRDAKPQRAKRHKMSPADEQAWQELLRSNPQKARELVRQATMAKKKRSKKRKRNSRKGIMPAGLKPIGPRSGAQRPNGKIPRNGARAKFKRPRRRRRAAQARLHARQELSAPTSAAQSESATEALGQNHQNESAQGNQGVWPVCGGRHGRSTERRGFSNDYEFSAD